MHGEVIGSQFSSAFEKKNQFLIHHPVCRYDRRAQMCLWHV